MFLLAPNSLSPQEVTTVLNVVSLNNVYAYNNFYKNETKPFLGSGCEILWPHRIRWIAIRCVNFASLMAQVSSCCLTTEQGAPFLHFWSRAFLLPHTLNISVLLVENNPSSIHRQCQFTSSLSVQPRASDRGLSDMLSWYDSSYLLQYHCPHQSLFRANFIDCRPPPLPPGHPSHPSLSGF